MICQGTKANCYSLLPSVNDCTGILPSFRATRLIDDDSWYDCMNRLHYLDQFAGDCYSTWGYYHAVWGTIYKKLPAWLIELQNGKNETVAAMILREDNKGLRGIHLRSFDYHVMRMAPFIGNPTFHKDVYQAMALHCKGIGHVTGASLMRLFKIDPESAVSIKKEFSASEVTVDIHPFAETHQLEITDSFADYWKNKSRKSRYNMRRAVKLLATECGDSLAFTRFRGLRFDSLQFKEIWQEVSPLLESSWQVDNDKTVMEFNNAICRYWANMGALDLCVLSGPNGPLAVQINVITNDTQWVVLLAYDRNWQKFSPGKVLFYMELEDSCTLGDRLVELGPDFGDWKKFWSTGSKMTQTVTLSCGGLRGGTWEAFQYVKNWRRGKEEQ